MKKVTIVIALQNFLHTFSLVVYAFFAASKRKSEEEADTSEPAPKRVSTLCMKMSVDFCGAI